MKKIILFNKKKLKLVKPVNKIMNFLKFNNIFFFKIIFFNYMLKGNINDYIINYN